MTNLFHLAGNVSRWNTVSVTNAAGNTRLGVLRLGDPAPGARVHANRGQRLLLLQGRWEWTAICWGAGAQPL